jgi:LacI family gluconate utilization system Gnt-I transcriptional repressor
VQPHPAPRRADARPATADVPARRSRRGHGRITLDDVAALAGVTKITVSRFLREPDRVAAPTAARIRDALADTGYVRNKQAELLASGRSRIVAALIPNLAHSIFGETVHALSEGLQTEGFELLLASTAYSLEREEDQLRALLGWAPAAVVVTGRRHSDGARRLLLDAHAAGTPVVEVWDYRRDDAAPFAQIGFDHAKVGREMARHLLDAGHRVLAYVGSPIATDFRARERGAAFVAAARRAGAEVIDTTAAAGDPFDAGRAALAALLGPARRRVAIACANDQVACGALLEALDRHHVVPRDVAVLGFGDYPLGRQLRPALSTVRPPSRAIGEAAAQAVVAALKQDAAPQGRALACTLIARGSTRTEG